MSALVAWGRSKMPPAREKSKPLSASVFARLAGLKVILIIVVTNAVTDRLFFKMREL
jgi:hypothetical protein